MQATKKMLLCAAVHFFLPFLLHWCVRVSLDGNRNSSIDLNFKSPKGRKRSGNNGERKDRPAAAATVNYHSSVDVVVSLKVAAWRTTNLSSQLVRGMDQKRENFSPSHSLTDQDNVDPHPQCLLCPKPNVVVEWLFSFTFRNSFLHCLQHTLFILSLTLQA